MTKNQFSDRFAGMADEDLIRIAEAGGDDYEPDAIAAARHELATRNIEPDVAARISEEASRESRHNDGKADLPLSNGQWLLFLLIAGFLPFSLGGASILGMRGYHRKSREAFVTILWGWALLAAISVGMSLTVG